jgi:hypothetical protein
MWSSLVSYVRLIDCSIACWRALLLLVGATPDLRCHCLESAMLLAPRAHVGAWTCR